MKSPKSCLLLWASLLLPNWSAWAQSPDPLPSWKDGAAKAALLRFVEQVTADGGEQFVPPAERIAVFDNDGTLWPENPLPFQLAFALDSLRQVAEAKSALRDDPLVRSALAGDLPALLADHHQGLLHVISLTHEGMTTDEFASRVDRWIRQAKHPRFDAPYDRCTYRPMQELLSHLRAQGFKTFIVSGGGADFMRVWSERVYGIPPEQVIGSYGQTRFELRDGRPTLVKTRDNFFVDDKEGKPVGIHQFIGRRPILCVGNSDGDQAMLEYTTLENSRPSLGVIVHHTDAEREYAYDSAPKSSGKLVTALADAPRRGWVVVDMRRDWRVVLGGEE